MLKDTPSSSPKMNEDDIVYIEDVDEVIDDFNVSINDDDEEAIEKVPIKQDASYVFFGHKFGSVFCGFLSKDGKLAVTGSEEDKAYVWDTTSGNILLDCTGHKDSVIFAEFNFNESYLATGDMSGIILVWDMKEHTAIWEYNMGDATWMKWHWAANILIAGSVDGEVYMWKVPNGDCKVVQGYGCRAETATILPDGKRIAVGYEDGAIRLIDLKSSIVLSSIAPSTGHTGTITALDCHTDNNLILSAAVDGKTILSLSHTGKVVTVLQELNAHKEDIAQNAILEQKSGAINETDGNWVETVAFCKDSAFEVAATGTLNGEIFIWDISKYVLRHKIEQESGISKVVWKNTSSLLFSAGLDGSLRCFDAKTAQCLRIFVGHSADILDIHISDQGEKALTTSDDSTARIFDISDLI